MSQLRISVLHEKALSNAIKLLKAIGAEYAVKTVDGMLHGGLEVRVKPKRKTSPYPYGSLSKYVTPYINNCAVNQTISIPIGSFQLQNVYGSASSIASRDWGNGCHRIGTSNDKKSVLLTRTEKLDDLDDLFAQLGVK